MNRVVIHALVVVCAGAARPASPLSAQTARYALDGGGSVVRLQRAVGARADELRGLMAGGAGKLSVWRLELEVEYLEGSLQPRTATPARDLVEGRAMLGLKPVHWLTLKGGPHARGLILGGVTERWILWEGGARADAAIAAPAVRGYLELWRAFGGSVTNVTGTFGSSQGGEAGISVRLPSLPVWLRFSYGIERAGLASDVQVDTVESVTMAMGLGAAR